eukprot:s344_g31.t1
MSDAAPSASHSRSPRRRENCFEMNARWWRTTGSKKEENALSDYDRDEILKQNPLARALVELNQHVITCDSQDSQTAAPSVVQEQWYRDTFQRRSGFAKELQKHQRRGSKAVLLQRAYVEMVCTSEEQAKVIIQSVGDRCFFVLTRRDGHQELVAQLVVFVVHWAAKAPMNNPCMNRNDLKSSIFNALDQDGDRRLGSAEMRRFAELSGFEGDDADWQEEYQMLCDPQGCDFNAFGQLLDDDSEDGLFVSDAELVEMMQELIEQGASLSTASAGRRTLGAATEVGLEYFQREREAGLYDGEWPLDFRFRTVLLRSDGTAVALGDHPDAECSIPPLEGSAFYVQVSAGFYHTVLLRSDGTAVACGKNSQGQCNIPPLDAGMSYTQVSAGESHTVLLRNDGTVVTCGGNGYGESRIPLLQKDIVQISEMEALMQLLQSDADREVRRVHEQMSELEGRAATRIAECQRFTSKLQIQSERLVKRAQTQADETTQALQIQQADQLRELQHFLEQCHLEARQRVDRAQLDAEIRIDVAVRNGLQQAQRGQQAADAHLALTRADVAA